MSQEEVVNAKNKKLIKKMPHGGTQMLGAEIAAQNKSDVRQFNNESGLTNDELDAMKRADSKQLGMLGYFFSNNDKGMNYALKSQEHEDANTAWSVNMLFNDPKLTTYDQKKNRVINEFLLPHGISIDQWNNIAMKNNFNKGMNELPTFVSDTPRMLNTGFSVPTFTNNMPFSKPKFTQPDMYQ